MRTALQITAIAALAAALVVSPASGGSGSSGVGASKRASVSVRDDLFSPKSLRVSRGTTVTWRWRGSNPHNVRFRRVPKGASKRGSSTQSSGRFSRTLRKRGRYGYVCTIHELLGMTGSVTVK